ncbi:MAG: YdeI/OmpD-associated family protein [Cytophagaceae bacterium]|jgi:uncharacterized protein YdeI (YjbR/CyaY-like superfamily)|nr:YdeI/OmpD-associated family protein [Cytophagaceae bacterium]
MGKNTLKRNPGVDQYLLEGCGRCALGGTPACKVHRWTIELETLRQWVLEAGLVEEVKWGVPCYTHHGKNVVIVAAFKEYCSLNFFKGVLIQDSPGMLEKPGDNSRVSRIVKFTELKQIQLQEKDIRTLLKEAIAVEEAGKKVEKIQPEEILIPEELAQKFKDLPSLKKAFYALTPGRQRSYILHINSAKQTATKVARIEKCIPKIMEGKGFNEW